MKGLEKENTECTRAHPFIKWAGGKSQLLDEIRARYPKEINRYCEPFVGSGAVLLDILTNFSPKSVRINDINRELINLYKQIQGDVDAVIKLLGRWQTKWWNMDHDERSEMYLEMRDKYNHGIGVNDVGAEMAALFIFLNRTCFNGLYRVNRTGQFNVSMGSYVRPKICDEENLHAVNKLLKNVEITYGDYSGCEDFITEGTFVYIDPPYRPLSRTSSFTSYSEDEFSDKQQVQLAEFIKKLSKRGAKIIASNSDPKNVNRNDEFFDELYSEFLIDRISATRRINSKADRRGSVTELLIRNF